MSDSYSQHVEACAVCRENPDSFCPKGFELLTGSPMLKLVSMEHDNFIFEAAASVVVGQEELISTLMKEMSISTTNSKASTESAFPYKTGLELTTEMKLWKDQILNAFNLTDDALKLLPYADKDVTACNDYIRKAAKHFDFGIASVYGSPTGHKPSEPKFQQIPIKTKHFKYAPILHYDYSKLEVKAAAAVFSSALKAKSDCPACKAGIPVKKVTYSKPDPTKDVVVVKTEPEAATAPNWKASVLGLLVAKLMGENA